MDLSEEYIKMCYGAFPKLKNEWKPKVGDLFHEVDDWPPEWAVRINEYDEDGYMVCMMTTTNFISNRGITWLPRISDLIGLTDPMYRACVEDFIRYMRDTLPVSNKRGLDEFKTLEQCVLAWYMWSVYNKIWKGDQWL